MKKCTFCAEEISDEAVKCKHCGSMLNSPVYSNYSNAEPDRSSFSANGMVGAFIALLGLVIGLTGASSDMLFGVIGVFLLIAGASIGAKHK